MEELKKLKDLKWEVFKVREEIKDKGIRDELGKLLYKIVNIIEERERGLLFKMLEECEEEQGMISKERGLKIDKRGLKVIRRNLGKKEYYR